MLSRRELMRFTALATSSFAAQSAYSQSEMTMTFNTGNNVPSTDPRDLYDNAENLDKLLNGAEPFYADRLGKLRESWAGMESSFTNAQEGRETTFTASQADKESRFQAFLVSAGYVSKGDYAANVVLEERNEYVAVDAATTGTSPGLYRPNASATLPLTLTGAWATDSASLLLLGDDVLRQDLANPDIGAGLVGFRAPNGDSASVQDLSSTSGAGMVITESGMSLQSYASSLNTEMAASAFAGNRYGAIMLLGDSNAEGAGGELGNFYPDGYMGLFVRSAMAMRDYGPGVERGFGYEVITRLSSAVGTGTGVSTTGSLINGGISDSRISLGPGQNISITGREIATADVFYVPDMSSGTLEIYLNGVLVDTKLIGGSGSVASTFPTQIIGAAYEDRLLNTSKTDIVEIRAVGGTVVVSGIMAVRNSLTGSLVYSNIRQGWGFDDFAEDERVGEATDMLKSFFTVPTPRMVCVCLGTNNMISAVGKQKTPEAYVAALDGLITKYRDNLYANTSFAVWVPPRPLESTPLGDYLEYVKAITEYCYANDIYCIRMDMTPLGDPLPSLMADPRHFNSEGHEVAALALCRAFQVPPQFNRGISVVASLNVAMNPPWTGNTVQSIKMTDHMYALAGVAASGGSSDSLIGTVSISHRPARDIYLTTMAVMAGGAVEPVQLTVGSDGSIRCTGSEWVSVQLDGLTYSKQ